MTTIGFVGLGIMGAPTAANLLAEGHTVPDRAAARAQGSGSLDHSVLPKVLENVSGKAAS